MSSMLFISCAHSDYEAAQALRTALTPACARHKVEICDALSLLAGADVLKEMQRLVQKAQIILVVLTPDYLVSEAHTKEWKLALQQKQQRGSILIPIRWKPVAESALPPELAGIQSLPRGHQYVCGAENRDQLLSGITDEVARYLIVAPPATGRAAWPPAELPELSAKQYSSLHSKALLAVEQLEKLGVGLHLESAQARAASLRKSLVSHLYKVVITGKSRAGKSTLLNALLGRTICPSKRRLTTAVPIIIVPGSEEAATISIEGGTQVSLRGPLSADDLRAYADQDQNPVNCKKVKEVRVTLADRVLAMGVSYIDIPGFDDPTEAMSASAWKIMADAHALIFVIDISPYANGGFVIDLATINFLKQGKERGCKILLIGNKADVLTPARREKDEEEIKEEIQTRCRQAGFEAPPFFLLSATQANDGQAENGSVPEPFSAFYAALWRHLWNTEGIGLRRLYQVFGQLQVGSEEVVALFAVRAKKEDERARLRIALSKCQDDCISSQEQCKAGFAADRARLADLVAGAQVVLRKEIATYIGTIPNDHALPRIGKALKQLQPAVRKTDQSIIDQVAHRMATRTNTLSKEVEVRLGALREEAGLPGTLKRSKDALLSLPGWQAELERPAIIDTRSESILVAAVAISVAMGGIVGLLAGLVAGFSAAGAAGAVASWVGDRFVAHASSREDLVEKCYQSLTERLAKLQFELEKKHDEVSTELVTQIQQGMAPFMKDMSQRLEDIRPPTEDEQQLHAKFTALSQEALQLLAQTLKG